MMKALFNEKGSQFRIDIIAEQPAQDFINAHADALNSGFQQVKMSDAMRQRLQRSNYIFSGMKTFHELNEAFPSLIDENGNRKPFEQFLNDVQRIDRTYNQNYLRAEYNFCQASATMAAKWEQFQQDGDRYNLQYRTQRDKRVRPEHAALDRVTLPMSDPFWEEFYPPNGWNCRCTVVQVRKSKYPVTPHDEAMALGEEATGKDTKGIFHFNPGIEQKTFPDYNPYTIRECRNCDVAQGKFAWRPNRQFCRACVLIQQCYQEKEKENVMHKPSIEEKRAIYAKPLEEQFTQVYQTKEGFTVSRHLLKDVGAMDYERVLNAAAIYAKEGNVLMMPEIHKSEMQIRTLMGLPEKSNPDLKVVDTFIDVKSPFSVDNIVKNATKSSRQGAIACITDDHCIINVESLEYWGNLILRDSNYLQREVHFIVDGILYKCKGRN